MIKKIPQKLLQNVDPLSKSQMDDLYKAPIPYRPFVFDQRVVDVFPDMIGRSVPGYWLSNSFIGLLTKRFAKPQTNIYDLGCSLGASTYSILQHNAQNGATIIAVDSSKEMITRFRESLIHQNQIKNVHLSHGDIRTFPLENASVVILNYVLQFIPPPQRDALLSKIYHALLPGGVLLLSEKLRFGDEQTEQKLRTWHHDFKAASGYSPIEIEQKARDIRQVMQTDTQEELQHRVQQAGYTAQTVWMQCYNFVSFVVEK
ncbi:MAG: carboxy-S-adenosyl-L-methionine synthase CmoA [Myxococcota bacterium]|nr:carboxy-S-adenosyl-L-methionine synthase CmoA [Myxococcota bacterium]